MWERLTRNVKRCLIKVVGRGTLSFMELSTLLVEIECVLNARPITYIFDGTEGLSYPLTPSQLINGRNRLQKSSQNHFEIISNHETLSTRAIYFIFFHILYFIHKTLQHNYRKKTIYELSYL